MASKNVPLRHVWAPGRLRRSSSEQGKNRLPDDVHPFGIDPRFHNVIAGCLVSRNHCIPRSGPDVLLGALQRGSAYAGRLVWLTRDAVRLLERADVRQLVARGH
jgi:hypothetical protein